MVKSGITVLVLLGLAGFGYFYLTSDGAGSRTDRAKTAARNLGDAVRDKGVAELVEVRLKTKFGIDATRFVHAFFDEGHVVVYGMVPAGIDPGALQSEAAKVPGVSDALVLVQPRPDFIVPLKSIRKDSPRDGKP